jgi:hypothetical protein
MNLQEKRAGQKGYFINRSFETTNGPQGTVSDQNDRHFG